jgi:hypothetical protein
LSFRVPKFFLLAHPDYKNLRSSLNPPAPPNSVNSFCSGIALRSFYLSSSIRPASPCRDDFSGRPNPLFSVGIHASSSSPSRISPSHGPNVFVSDPPPDALALPLCPVCGIASAKSCFDCEQQFCINHIYACADCGTQYCGACLDAHHSDGHWADSDTASELAASRAVVRPSSVNSPDLRCSELAASQCAGRSSSASELAASRAVVRPSSVNSPDLLSSELVASQCAGRSSSASELAASRAVVRPSSVNSPDLRSSELVASHHVARLPSDDLRPATLATSHQHRQASWSAIPARLKSLLSQHLTRLAMLIACTFQNIALQSEAGS